MAIICYTTSTSTLRKHPVWSIRFVGFGSRKCGGCPGAQKWGMEDIKMTTARSSRVLRLIPLLIIIFSLSFPAYAKYSGGTGEPDDPYQIATAEDLILLGEMPEDYDKHFILTADIDLDPNLPGRKVFDRAVIAPDANDANSWFDGTSFTGIFDGNGHTISHLTIAGMRNLGLFGQINGATISDLGLETVDVNGTGYYYTAVGGLVGENLYGSIITCYSTGTTIGAFGVGGLVGKNWRGNITSSYSTATVTSYNITSNYTGYDCGGLVGSNSGCITSSYSTGTVDGEGGVGGLVGGNVGDIVMSYSTGTVSGERTVGGLVGVNFFMDYLTPSGWWRSRGTIIDCHYTGTVTGSRYVGGFVGVNDASIIGSYSTGMVNGNVVTGQLRGNVDVGGLVGLNTGNIANCYSKGKVQGSSEAGGLVGQNSKKIGDGWGHYSGKIGLIDNCYSIGAVSGVTRIGGLIGCDYFPGSNIAGTCFWNVENSGQSTSAGGTGKTTAEMQTSSTFIEAGWDFVDETANGTDDIWWILEGQDYPRLWWETEGN